SQGIHGGHIYAAIPPVPIIHDMSDLITNFCSGIDHPWGHQTGKIGLDLKINAVRMKVVLPMTRFGRKYPVQYVVPSRLVGMPQFEIRMGKGISKSLLRCIYTMLFEHLHKGKIHIYII